MGINIYLLIIFLYVHVQQKWALFNINWGLHENNIYKIKNSEYITFLNSYQSYQMSFISLDYLLKMKRYQKNYYWL